MRESRRRIWSWPVVSAAVWVLAGCAGPPVAENVSLAPGPNPAVPLVGVLTFTSDRPVVPTLLIEDGERRQTVTPDPEARTEHEIPVLGLRPARTHTVTVTLRDARGRETTLEPLSIETPPLPDDTPPIAVTVRRPAAMEPGITMIPVFRWKSATEGDRDWGSAVFGVDAEGEVVWFYKDDLGAAEVRRKRNGNLLFGQAEDGRMVEMDMLGNVVSTWYSAGVVLDELPEGAIPVDTDVFHHDVIELPSGNFLGLGLALRHFEDFPAEYPPGTKRAPTNVAGDVLIEFRPDGSTVRKWEVLDILDPERLGEGSLNTGFYDDQYEGKVDPLPIDISHSNAILYLEDEDAAVVSSNVQCVIYKVDLATGELEWLLGDPAGWREPWASKLLEPVGELIWPCHQHGIELTPRGTYLLYDNGGGRAIPPNPPMPPDERYSRAVEYRVDEEARTVEEVWSYGPEHERFISPYISDADHLPETGNVLITDGGRMAGPDGEIMGTFGGRQWGRVLEVTYGEQPEKVWELVVDDPGGRYAIYRSQRFRSLYPKLDRPTG
ncbi:MAG TPA: aryl-sulfate sulfotransferase [Thermoanaerobaculia bacterium]|nr:aryl-sulfate sulfotransferase [Thermoanaerobaculia bacterium]